MSVHPQGTASNCTLQKRILHLAMRKLIVLILKKKDCVNSVTNHPMEQFINKTCPSANKSYKQPVLSVGTIQHYKNPVQFQIGGI